MSSYLLAVALLSEDSDSEPDSQSEFTHTEAGDLNLNVNVNGARIQLGQSLRPNRGCVYVRTYVRTYVRSQIVIRRCHCYSSLQQSRLYIRTYNVFLK